MSARRQPDAGALEQFERPGFVRLTASDRPGVAQPVPERDVPLQPWGRIGLGALVLFALLLAAWEWHWRAFGREPGYRNSDGAWAEQRRRIDEGEAEATVLIGASRMLFDVQLDVWESVTGERPIQLALEGTSPVPFLEDLANDPDFTGRLVVGVAPGPYFGGGTLRQRVIEYYADQGPSQRSGHWLSQRLIEPYFAFYDPDFALAVVVRRQAWPLRPGIDRVRPRVRKLAVMEQDRNTHLWDKVERDAAYRELARGIWMAGFNAPPPPTIDTPEKKRAAFEEKIARTAAAIAKLKARGVPVVFVRPPSVGPQYEFEQKLAPRAETWDALLARSGVGGVHFEDHPQLQGLELPEWSHLSHEDAKRYTAALVPLVEAEFASQRGSK